MIRCSVGICLYNEEKNISHMLTSLLAQKLASVSIREIIIIVSGSTDKTLELVQQFKKKDKRIKIFTQRKRFGKASAVNLFIDSAQTDILVLLTGDILLEKTTIEYLVKKFKNQRIGMTGSHPLPLQDNRHSIMNFAGFMLWSLHHFISLKHPKMGEAIAFRKIFKRIPVSSSVDEANIEPLITGQGYLLCYVPGAFIYNKSPQTVADFISQRRRIFCGHLAVSFEQHYLVATLHTKDIFLAYLQFLKTNWSAQTVIYSIFVIFLELYSRVLGWWDFAVVKKDNSAWPTIVSTKQLVTKYT